MIGLSCRASANPLGMRRLVDRERHCENLSVNWIQIWGTHRRTGSDRSTRLYYILSGNGWFQIGAQTSEDVRTGDLAVIPRGVPYSFGGYMTYLLVNQPAFTDGDDQKPPETERGERPEGQGQV